MIECREDPRIPVEIPVSFSMIGAPDTREGTMFDISAGGCAVTSAADVPTGAGVKLLIRSLDLAAPITVQSAAVRWTHHGEFGVEFLDLTELDRGRLRRLLQAASPRSTTQH
ncbi:MAG TPA: PilZ domain-containing protein [Nitrospira sp.]|jgi:hypothetical protein|nr:PilZ domain-containing protein [Nitrospira sp.]